MSLLTPRRRHDAEGHGLVFVAYELRHMRSRESIQALERLLTHGSLDVRFVSLDSLGEHLSEGVLLYARRFAAGRQWQEKLAAEPLRSEYEAYEDSGAHSYRATCAAWWAEAFVALHRAKKHSR